MHALSLGLALHESAFMSGPIREGYCAFPMALTFHEFALVVQSVRVMLRTYPSYLAMVPGAHESNTVGSHQGALTMALSSLEFAFIHVAGRCDLFAPALGNAMIPVAFVSLSIAEGHLAVAVPETAQKVSLVQLSVGQPESAPPVRLPIFGFARVAITIFINCFCHLGYFAVG